MRSRLWLAVVVGLSSLAYTASAQDSGSSDPLADGLVAGNYLRISGGALAPLNAQGSFRDWTGGSGIALMWENWESGSSGVDRLGFGIGATYSTLPFTSDHFLATFTTLQGVRATAATASSAPLLTIETNLRIRIPSPFIMPSIVFGFGYLNFHPSTIHYSAPTGDATTSQARKYGGELSIGGALDKQIFDRYAVFGEALYMFGFTSLGQGFATPGGACTGGSCDVLKNLSAGVIRGGLRVRVGR